MLEIWTSLGIWIRCQKGFSPPDFRNLKRLDDLTNDPELFFYQVADMPYQRIHKIHDDAEEKKISLKNGWKPLLNEEENQAIEKVWNLLDKVHGVRVLQVATLHGGCSFYGKDGNGSEGGWDGSYPLEQDKNLPIKLKSRMV